MIKSSRLFLYLFWVFVTISFLTTQLTNDFRVFWAYGRFVSNSEETGIGALIDTWEMKGLLFKTYLYVEYALTSLFSTSFDEYCQTIYKIIGIIPFLGILLGSTLLFPKRYLNGYKKFDVFIIASILLLSVHFASHYQAEMWGVSLLLLSFSIYLHEGWKSKIISALFYSLCIYLKTPIPLLGGSLVVASIILKKQSVKEAIKDVLPFTFFSVFFLLSTLLLIYIYYPQEIKDIWDASYYQKTLLHDPSNIPFSFISLIYMMLKTTLYNPINGIGIVSAFILSYKYLREKTWCCLLYLVLIWIFPLLYVFISNCFFVYHYYLLAFSSILTIIILFNSDISIKKKVLAPIALVFTFYYLFILSSISPTNIFARNMFSVYCNEIKKKENVTVGCELGKGKVLFLDDGTGAFFFSNKSYLRYFYPLPLQRAEKGDNLVNMPVHIITKNKALSFDGDYITLQRQWFLSGGNNDEIIDKIKNEYGLYKEIVYSGYSWTLFKNVPVIDTLYVYKRK